MEVSGFTSCSNCFKCHASFICLGLITVANQMKNINYEALIYVIFSILSSLVQFEAAGFGCGCVSTPNYLLKHSHTEYRDSKYWRNKLRNDFCDINWSLANCLKEQMCLLPVNDHHTCDVHLIHFTMCHLYVTCCWKSQVCAISHCVVALMDSQGKQFYYFISNA